MGFVRFDHIARECRDTFKGSLENVPIVGLEHIEPYDMLLKQCETNVETTFTKLFKKGQILFGRRRAYQHKACVATFDGVCSGDITVIEPIEGKVNGDLLPFIVQNDDFFEHAIKGSNGALSPRVKWQHMANYEVNLPGPDRQKELADRLWAAYEVKQSYLKMIKAIDELVKSRFIKMFGGIQNGIKWPLKKLSEICHLVNGYAFKSSLYSDEGYSVIRIANVQKGYIDNSDRAYYPVSLEKEFRDSILEKGDILISLTGNVGRVGVITDEHLPAALNQRVQGLRLRKGVPMNNDFLFCVLNLDEFESLCIENASGSAQLNLSTIWVRDFQIICPPFEKQQEFTQFANQADKSKVELSKCIEAINKVIKSLINENL